MRLEAVVDAEGEPIWRPGSNLSPVEPLPPELHLGGSGRVEISFQTPVRLVRDGVPIRAEALEGPALALAAVRRVGQLRARFVGGEPDADFAAAKAQAGAVAILDRDLSWVDRRRHSTRQGRLITLGGLAGRVILDLSAAPAVLPFLETCTFVHLGKGATLGFGKIALVPA